MSFNKNNFYSSIQQYEIGNLHVFDEGPQIVKTSLIINSSSISTSAIDAFRQGVEITQEKYINGLVKIYAGTPGHIIKPLSFGINNLDIISQNSYIEIEYFNPIDYLKAQEPGKKLKKVITFPIITSDSNQQENYVLNGIIEPLTIRPVISFFSIEFPFESHGVRGSMMGGNLDPRFASGDQILTIDYYKNKINRSYYLDAFETLTPGSTKVPLQTGYVNENFNYVDSCDDTIVYLNAIGITATTHGQDMVDVFTVMTGTTGAYIPPGKKSGVAGFVYNTAYGTDSIAFGGLTY
jgi:hypothetical protein